jgi:hypothetical protein
MLTRRAATIWKRWVAAAVAIATDFSSSSIVIEIGGGVLEGVPKAKSEKAY